MTATPTDDRSHDHRSLADISGLWRLHAGRHGERDAAFYIGLTRRALALGEPLFACDVCRAALNHVAASSRDHHTLQKLHGLALARSGVLDEALQLAESLIDGGLLDEETISLAARIHKDLWQQSVALSARAHHLQAGRALYARAYAMSHGIQSGINTATLALVAGDVRQAHLVAKEVEATCRSQLVQAPHDYWLLATLAESTLVLGRTEEASELYRAAIIGMEDYGSIAATRRNARLALPTYELDSKWLEQALPMPVVAVFCGHMPDRVDRPDDRFPERIVGNVEERLRSLLAEHGVRVGYGSAAAGSDILFHEALIEAGYETHVVLPVSRERFCRTSVGVGSPWEARFDAVLERAASVIVLSDSAEGTLAFSYANRVLLGLARIKARLIDGSLKGFAVWDDLPGAAGGTGSAVREWRSAGLEIQSVHPTRDELTVLAPAPSDDDLEDLEEGRRIVSLLFADTIGFSKLEETQVNAFVEYFLGGVAKLMNEMPEAPLTRNTWGDALYFAFASVEQAGSFALDLADLVNLTDWPSIGLPAGLSIRISLHVGPTTVIFDPIIGRRSYSGTHVSRAARLEPVTPPGQVFASQAFAALCEFAQVKLFTCDYAGSLPLAKGYGTYPVYHLRRQSTR